jgi:DNA-binding NtrC family response regulator
VAHHTEDRVDALFQLSEDQIAKARVVVVDDDSLVTSSLTSFFSLELEIDPIVFNESPKAAKYLETNQVDMVISDFLMPELDGIGLLQAARDSQPEVPRVLLTGYADKENAIKAINEVGVFQYLEKPWENEQLRQVVINGLTRLMLMRMLSDKMSELQDTRKDLAGLKKALVRAFA